MFTRIKTQIAGVILLIGIFAFYGCSGSGDSNELTVVRKAVDTVATKVARDLVEATFASSTVTENFVEMRNGQFENLQGANDMLVVDSILYAATDNGLIVYNFRDKSKAFVGDGQQFKALAVHDGNLYAGGDFLYIVGDSGLEPVKMEENAPITALISGSSRLLIGTEDGLIAKGPVGEENLLENVSVTCLQYDNDGLWIGTDGQGLFRWDGDLFVKRYLIRDTSIFNYVYDLDFNHGHLFVGASTGFFIYDGGCWDQWTEEMGIPSNRINSIDASDWMVYIGTDKGAISYFNDNLFPVKNFETTPVDLIRRMGNKIIAADDKGGIFLKRGYAVTALIEPLKKEEAEVFTQADDDI